MLSNPGIWFAASVASMPALLGKFQAASYMSLSEVQYATYPTLFWWKSASLLPHVAQQLCVARTD